MEPTTYSADILRLAASIVADTLMDAPDGRAERHSPVCGSRITVDVVLDADDRVLAIGEKVRACAFGQAAAAVVRDGAPGKTAAELRTAHDALRAWLRADDATADTAPPPDGFPGIRLFTPARPLKGRHASILLAFDAVAAAAEEAQVRRAA